jgi:hypothetical protein
MKFLANENFPQPSVLSIFEIAMIIERTKKEIVIRLAGKFNVDDLQDMTDWLEFKELAKRSKAVQKDVDDLVKKIKKGRWAKTKLKLGL